MNFRTGSGSINGYTLHQFRFGVISDGGTDASHPSALEFYRTNNDAIPLPTGSSVGTLTLSQSPPAPYVATFEGRVNLDANTRYMAMLRVRTAGAGNFFTIQSTDQIENDSWVGSDGWGTANHSISGSNFDNLSASGRVDLIPKISLFAYAGKAPSTATITISPTSLVMSETQSAEYTISPNTRPIEDVVISLVKPLSNTGNITLPASATFAPASWRAVTITVSAGNDAGGDDQVFSITHALATDDPGYNGLSLAAVSVTVEDDDRGGPAQPNIGMATNTADADGSITLSWNLAGSNMPTRYQFCVYSGETFSESNCPASELINMAADDITGRTVVFTEDGAGVALVNRRRYVVGMRSQQSRYVSAWASATATPFVHTPSNANLSSLNLYAGNTVGGLNLLPSLGGQTRNRNRNYSPLVGNTVTQATVSFGAVDPDTQVRRDGNVATSPFVVNLNNDGSDTIVVLNLRSEDGADQKNYTINIIKRPATAPVAGSVVVAPPASPRIGVAELTVSWDAPGLGVDDYEVCALEVLIERPGLLPAFDDQTCFTGPGNTLHDVTESEVAATSKTLTLNHGSEYNVAVRGLFPGAVPSAWIAASDIETAYETVAPFALNFDALTKLDPAPAEHHTTPFIISGLSTDSIEVPINVTGGTFSINGIEIGATGTVSNGDSVVISSVIPECGGVLRLVDVVVTIGYLERRATLTPRLCSTDRTLNTLSLTSGGNNIPITPGFASTLLEYTAAVANDVASVMVTATHTHPNSTIEISADEDNTIIDNVVNLVEGQNPINITVTSESGNTQDYTIIVTRAVPNSSYGGATLSRVTPSGVPTNDGNVTLRVSLLEQADSPEDGGFVRTFRVVGRVWPRNERPGRPSACSVTNSFPSGTVARAFVTYTQPRITESVTTNYDINFDLSRDLDGTVNVNGPGLWEFCIEQVTRNDGQVVGGGQIVQEHVRIGYDNVAPFLAVGKITGGTPGTTGASRKRQYFGRDDNVVVTFNIINPEVSQPATPAPTVNQPHATSSYIAPIDADSGGGAGTINFKIADNPIITAVPATFVANANASRVSATIPTSDFETSIGEIWEGATRDDHWFTAADGPPDSLSVWTWNLFVPVPGDRAGNRRTSPVPYSLSPLTDRPFIQIGLPDIGMVVADDFKNSGTGTPISTLDVSVTAQHTLPLFASLNACTATGTLSGGGTATTTLTLDTTEHDIGVVPYADSGGIINDEGGTVSSNIPLFARQPILGVADTEDTTFNFTNCMLTVKDIAGNAATQTLPNFAITLRPPPVLTITASEATFDEADDRNIVFNVAAAGSRSDGLMFTATLTGADDFVANSNRTQTGTIQSDGSGTISFPIDDDNDIDADATVTAMLNPGEYNIGTPAAATATVTDTSDAAGVTFRTTADQLFGLLRIHENEIFEYTMKLDTSPAEGVTVGITVTSNNANIATVNSGGGDPAKSTTLEFTRATWNTPQTVTMTGVNDNFRNTPSLRGTAMISHAAATTGDATNYAASLALGTISVDVIDDDITTPPGVVSASSGDGFISVVISEALAPRSPTGYQVCAYAPDPAGTRPAFNNITCSGDALSQIYSPGEDNYRSADLTNGHIYAYAVRGTHPLGNSSWATHPTDPTQTPSATSGDDLRLGSFAMYRGDEVNPDNLLVLDPVFNNIEQAQMGLLGNYDIATTVPVTATQATLDWRSINRNIIVNDASTSTIITSPHTISLAKTGDTIFSFEARQGNANVNTFDLTISKHRAASKIATLDNLVLDGITLNEIFDSGTITYTADVANDVTSTRITPDTTNDQATVEYEAPQDTDGKTADAAVNLVEGENKIIVTVTAEDNSESKTYTVTVTRQFRASAPRSVSLVGEDTTGSAQLTVNWVAESGAGVVTLDGYDVCVLAVTTADTVPTFSDSACVAGVFLESATGGEINNSSKTVTLTHDTEYAAAVRATLSGGENSAWIPAPATETAYEAPDAVVFPPQATATPGMVIRSDAITISGLSAGVSTPMSSVGGSISINGGPPTNIAMVQNGQIIEALVTIGACGTAAVTVTVTIGHAESTFTATPRVCANASLTALTLTADGSNLILNPLFDPIETRYAASVASDIETVVVAQAASAGATAVVTAASPATIDGNTVTLGGRPSENVITITVTPTRGTAAVYTITVTRGEGVHAPPRNVMASSAASGSITVTWDAPVSRMPTHYAVCIHAGSTFDSAMCTSQTETEFLAATTRMHVRTDLTDDIEYAIAVIAIYGDGVSGYASPTPVTVTPVVLTAAAPTGVSVSAGDGQITASWTISSAGAGIVVPDGYEVCAQVNDLIAPPVFNEANCDSNNT
ncbi:MAG: cadherin-like beta sandwich domain-containing protein, partial [bacterium]